MSDTTPDPKPSTSDLASDPEEYGSLTIEDEGATTVDPADLAGTAGPDDDEVGYSPDNGDEDQQGA